MRTNPLKLTLGWLLMTAALAHAVEATSLDSLTASHGTVVVGNLVFGSFATPAPNTVTTVDVTGFTAGGLTGLRFTSTAGPQFAASTGGGTRELLVDVNFTVTVTDPSFRIGLVTQSLDPATVAVGNAILRSFTQIPPSSSNVAFLFSCLQGTGVPAGTLCSITANSMVLNTPASTLDVDRQIQIAVGQKNGGSVGNASTGFFDIAFGEVASGCPAISVSPATIPDGSRQTAFATTTFTSSGGAGSTLFTLSGALPAGLLFDSPAGTLSGTPQDHGLFTVTVTVTDANGCQASQTYTFLVRDPRRRSARH